MKQIRVIFDTNIWISILIGKRLSVLKPLLDNGNVRVVISDTLVSELDDVLTRPKFRRYFSEDDIVAFFRRLNTADRYVITHYPSRCRDPKDDYLLELAVQSHADYLITGDDDLLALERIGDTIITSASAFQNILTAL